jgi:integrase
MTDRRTRTPVMYRGERVRGLYVRTLGDGTKVYEYAARIGGKMRSKRLTTTPPNVGAARHEIHDLHAGTRVEPGRITLGDLADAAFEAMQARVAHADPKRRRSQRTVDTDRQRFDAHVRPLLGNRQADALTITDVRRLVEGLSDKLAPSTASGTLSVLSSVLAFGQKYEGLQRNVARELPRDDRPGQARTKEPRYLSQAEGDALISKLSPSYRAVGALCFYMGLRVSEALGLTRADVDFGTRTLEVRQQRGPKETLVPLKTGASRRTLSMPDAVVRELQAVRSRDYGDVIPFPPALVFPRANRHNARRAVTTAAGHAGLNVEGRKPVSPHDLRHSFAAVLFEQNVNPVRIAALMGHRSARVLLDVYAGLLENIGRQSAADDLYASGFGR